MSNVIEVFPNPTELDFKRVGDKLTAFTRSQGGPDYNPQSLNLKFKKNRITLGEALITWNWGRLEIDLLFVEESRRGESIGRELVSRIEQFAETKEIIGIDVWTPSWQAEGYYEQLGYEELGRLPLARGNRDEPQFKIMYHKELRAAV